jgi:hypothetical protein
MDTNTDKIDPDVMDEWLQQKAEWAVCRGTAILAAFVEEDDAKAFVEKRFYPGIYDVKILRID